MSTPYTLLHPARDALFRNRDPDAAWPMLAPLLEDAACEPLTIEERRARYDLAALVLRAQKRFDQAVRWHQASGDWFQAGFCHLLQGQLQAAQQCWTPLFQERQNHWCLTLYGLASRQLSAYPTIFQVRNHLEGDLGHLLRAERWDYVQNALMYVDSLTQMNLETPKFMGRAFLNYTLDLPRPDQAAAFLEQAKMLLLRAQQTLPQDAEVYYHLAQIHHLQDAANDARLMLKQCLMISPSYTPATRLLQQLAKGGAAAT